MLEYALRGLENMEWLNQMSRAVDYIENNLTNDISYDEVAGIACCSTYYFQRIFSYIAGIPLSEYIRRRRMTKAAFELQLSGARVMEIAVKYGYSTAAAFNRAFHSVHGVAPTVARVKGTKLNAYTPISFTINITGGERMRYRIETRDRIRIVGVRVPLEEEPEQNFEIVPAFWDNTLKSSVFSKIIELTNKDPHGILGITAYENPKEIYYYIATSTDKPVPEDLVEYEIPAATWVIFECDGHFPESVQTIFRRFLTEWLPFSGYDYAELPDIEVYPISEKKMIGGHSEVWIAVKTAKK